MGNAAKILTQVLIAGAQVFARVVGEAYKQAAIDAARQRAAGAAARSSAGPVNSADTLMKKLFGASAPVTEIGLTEARQILSVKAEASPEEILKKYNFLFKQNDKATGGSFYLQSKIVRAMERIELELKKTNNGVNPIEVFEKEQMKKGK